ncbi:hypothetical protein ACPW96_21525 [Micromonospora sp. DT81.3]|uniref:hypothetical protein n=1 Tax=Micromonospora sp. DT81.3 TaxID=3416523 RepID=UPI003CED7EFB
MDNIQASLFGTRNRTDSRPSRHSESTYAFLRRAAGPVWDQCRDLIDDWLRAYPENARAALRARLRSGNDREFTSAFWELYLHEMYRGAGWTIAIEPSVATRPARPDFLVSKGDVAYYVEARCIVEGGSDGGAAARKQTVFDSLNEIDSGPFHLSVTTVTVGANMPSTKTLRRGLEKWLEGLDPDAVDYGVDGEQPGHQFKWVEDGWHLVFHPMPRDVGVRGTRAKRALGVYQDAEASFIDDITPLRRALSEKGSKYGELTHPLVLAINAGSSFHDEYDTQQALFGTVGWRFDFRDRDAGATPVLTKPGYWGWPGQPAHTHVAGVLLAEGMHYARVAQYAPAFWPHPSAAQGVAPLASWRVAHLVDGQTAYSEPSVSAPDLFGLPTGWPLGEPFPRR